jgi:hypothetical protein
MKRITLTICAAAFLLISCKNEKEAGDEKTISEDASTKAKNWQEYMTPSAMHQMMASWDGTWDGDITMWMPGAPEMKSKGTAVNRMIMGGRYQEGLMTGDMMGMPFEGRSLLAYDNHRKEFQNTWIDNMGTGIMLAKGTWDSTTKTITLKGTFINPETKEDCEARQTFQVVDDNTQILEMFGPDPKTGQEMKTMKIVYTRKK